MKLTKTQQQGRHRAQKNLQYIIFLALDGRQYKLLMGEWGYGNGVSLLLLRIEFLKLFDVDHDLERPTQFDSEALDEGLVGEQQKSRPVHFLLSEDRCVVLAVGGALKEPHHLCYGPGADVHRETYTKMEERRSVEKLK